MTFRSIATGIVIAGAALSAHSAPPAAKPFSHLQIDFAEAAGYASTPQGDYSFIAKSYTDFDGSRGGFVSIDGFGASYQFINCTGPEFADAVTMNASTGAVTVNAMVDPLNPNCFAFNFDGPALTLRFSGPARGQRARLRERRRHAAELQRDHQVQLPVRCLQRGLYRHDRSVHRRLHRPGDKRAQHRARANQVSAAKAVRRNGQARFGGLFCSVRAAAR